MTLWRPCRCLCHFVARLPCVFACRVGAFCSSGCRRQRPIISKPDRICLPVIVTIVSCLFIIVAIGRIFLCPRALRPWPFDFAKQAVWLCKTGCFVWRYGLFCKVKRPVFKPCMASIPKLLRRNVMIYRQFLVSLSVNKQHSLCGCNIAWPPSALSVHHRIIAAAGLSIDVTCHVG